MKLFRYLLIIGICGLTGLRSAASEAAHVNVIELDNQIISPVTQQYIVDAIERSESDGAVCLVIKLDTPGGLLESTRAIVKRMMNAKVPIAVYVAPSGSRAGSAGVFITLAAHVAAMAPSTNIGAAHPVVMGEGGPIKRLVKRATGEKEKEKEEVEETETDPMTEKIINDTVAWVTTIAKTRGRNEEWAKKAVTHSFSITETEALKEHVIDLIAIDVPELLKKIEGRKIELAGTPVELHTVPADVVTVPMSKRQEFLAVITNPNIAYLLMLAGLLGLFVEFTHPGVGFPGIAGLICLLLALYAFQALPINYAAVALILLGVGLLIAEIKIISHGLLAVGGIIALTLGSLMLFESPDPTLRVSWNVIVPTVATLAGIILFVVTRALSAQRRRVTTGVQGLIGSIGVARTALKPDGTVFVHGELWSAVSSKTVPEGARVRIKKIEGLQLFVEPVHAVNGGAKPGGA
ncbi:MAG: nodulation protein NfeD [Candidatus Omnitrophica bacterium]|nr:nodulation protein NfeD [Candidatus Omnitrophota bacterium]